METKANAKQAIENVRDFILASFEKLDTNQDGLLSDSELADALRAPGLTAKDAASLNFLQTRMSAIASTGEISKANLQAYFAALLEP